MSGVEVTTRASNSRVGIAQVRPRVSVDRRLTNRWSGRVKNRVPSSDTSVRAAQLNRYAPTRCRALAIRVSAIGSQDLK